MPAWTAGVLLGNRFVQDCLRGANRRLSAGVYARRERGVLSGQSCQPKRRQCRIVRERAVETRAMGAGTRRIRADGNRAAIAQTQKQSQLKRGSAAMSQ